MPRSYRVFVVLDREYGEQLQELASKGAGWIMDTPANREAAQNWWAEHRNQSHLVGVTTFRFRRDASLEDALIGEMDTIDLHHGTYSADPPYTELEAVGIVITERLRAELTSYGFDEFTPTAKGFLASRSARR